MDFLAQLDGRLVEPPKPRSKLASYFEAHMMFQGTYHTPSPTPSPPSSPALAPSTLAAPIPPVPSSQLHSQKRKREDNEADDATDAPSKRVRTLYATSKCAMQPLTPETTPPSSTFSVSPQQSQPTASIEECQPDVSRASKVRGAKAHAVQRQTFVRVGRYTLRRTAARAQREKGEASVT
jgi:hypothetical protein